ncbi:MAG: hypothetical protein ABWK05_04125 [Pyrobaculum sp.]
MRFASSPPGYIFSKKLGTRLLGLPGVVVCEKVVEKDWGQIRGQAGEAVPLLRGQGACRQACIEKLGLEPLDGVEVAGRLSLACAKCWP